MTRYLCVHASHRRDGKRVPVDLTDSVRLERSLVPRPAVYLAVTEDLVNEALSMRGPSPDRRVRIEQFISGEVEPANLPVVLVSERSSDRTRGRYEWDDLRRDTSLLDRLAEGPAGNQPGGDPNDEVILLEDEGRDSGGSGVLTRARPRVRVIPQGIFDLHELAARIAIAGSDEEAVIDAIRTAPHAAVGEVIADAPWRVVVPCPAIEPAEHQHDVLFTGLAGREPAVIYGSTASGLDLSVEETVPGDLFPSAELARVERGATMLVAAEVLTGAAVLLCAWVSGALALAARERATWLGVSLVLAAAAVAFAAMPWFVSREPDANMNDVFDVRRVYASRISLIGWAATISAVLFGAALIIGIAPVLAADTAPTASTSVFFDTAASPVVATIEVDVANAASSEPFTIEVRSFASAEGDGTVRAHLTGLASEDGTAENVQQLAMSAGDRYLAVAVAPQEGALPACTPAATTQVPGCTIVTIPAPNESASTSSASSTSSANVSVVTPPVTSSPSVSPAP
jgi:hypothetical protein